MKPLFTTSKSAQYTTHHNCIIRPDGSIWAGFSILVPATNHHVPDNTKRLIATIAQTLSVFTCPFQILGITQPVGIETLIKQTTGHVPNTLVSSWLRASQQDIVALHQQGLQTRSYWLFAQVKPPVSGGRNHTNLVEGMLASSETKATITQLTRRLQNHVQATPITAGQMAWLTARTIDRNLPPASGLQGGLPQYASVHLVEGKRASQDQPISLFKRLVQAGLGLTNKHHAVVQVDGKHRYESTLFVSSMPASFVSPSPASLFHRIAMLPFAADICAHVTPVSNVQARHNIVKQQRQLAGQASEYKGDSAGPPTALQEAQIQLDNQLTSLHTNQAESELLTTISVHVWAPDLAHLQLKTAAVKDVFEPEGFTLHQPTGGQVEGYLMAQPGMAASPLAKEYRQHLLAKDLAATLPFLTSEIGDPQGMPLGTTASSLSLQGSFATPVFFDPSRGPNVHKSGSLGVFGTLGSGKSYLAKRLVLATLEAGGTVTVLDRTMTGEYVALANVLESKSGKGHQPTAQIVSLDSDAPINLDPLQILPPEQALQVAVGLLSMLCHTESHSTETALLSHAVEILQETNQPLRAITDVLQTMEGTEGLRLKLAMMQRQPLAHMIFSQAKPLALTANYICFHAPGLSLPEKHGDGANAEHLPEHILARALLYVITSLSRKLMMETDHFSAQLIDEAWMLTQSPQGKALLRDAVRDGRKHNAAVWLLSQHPSDLGDDALSHLLGPRFVFNQSLGAAEQSLDFVGVPATEETIHLVTNLPQGTCLFTDLDRRTGVVKVLAAANTDIDEALKTAPRPKVVIEKDLGDQTTQESSYRNKDIDRKPNGVEHNNMATSKGYLKDGYVEDGHVTGYSDDGVYRQGISHDVERDYYGYHNVGEEEDYEDGNGAFLFEEDGEDR